MGCRAFDWSKLGEGAIILISSSRFSDPAILCKNQTRCNYHLPGAGPNEQFVVAAATLLPEGNINISFYGRCHSI